MNLLNGSNFLIWIDTDTPITAPKGLNYRPVVCGTSNGFNMTAEDISLRNKDDGGFDNSESGYISWNFDLDGYAISVDEFDSEKANFNEIANLFLQRRKFWAIQQDLIGSLKREGVVRISSHKETANQNSNYSFSANFIGQGKPKFIANGLSKIRYGYTLTNPFGNELTLTPQFESKGLGNNITFDFTEYSNGNYLFIIVPKDHENFNYWYNNTFNFGEIPDYVWRVVSIGDFDYYMTRNKQYITSSEPKITFTNV